MKISIDLIGKTILRAKPFIGVLDTEDYSYSTTPIKITNVTDSHFYYRDITEKYEDFNCKVELLSKYDDSNWCLYEPKPKEKE